MSNVCNMCLFSRQGGWNNLQTSSTSPNVTPHWEMWCHPNPLWRGMNQQGGNKVDELNSWNSPLVIKEPFLLRAESLLEVESQRSSGSESSGKNPLVRSTGDCSVTLALPTLLPGDSSGLWTGLRLWLTFMTLTSWFRSNWTHKGDVKTTFTFERSKWKNHSVPASHFSQWSMVLWSEPVVNG